ncbi:MAG TPA: hypothetical protein VLX92_21665 [Kofleriaceae bacterium]|nr:hypothetical protein [Kofleriaceae bacterium]
MTDDDEPIDDELAAAYAADRRVIAQHMAELAASRERLVLAVCEQLAARPEPRRARLPRRGIVPGLAVAAGVAIAGTVGFAIGRGTRPQLPPPPVERGSAPLAPPIDAGVADAPPPIDAPPPPRDAAVHASHPARPATPPLAEPLLIDQARAALRRGLPAEALAALERHRARYPDGQLREDRDVLLIEVALAQDRLADANEQIARYHQLYPHGGLAHRVDELAAELDRRIHHGP